MEIERQFLVDIIPSLPSGYDSILQGYVSLQPEIRIRAVRPMQGEEKFYLTVKRGAGLVREEWETAISSREFSHLVECLEKNTFFIEKRRYYLPLADGHVAEYNRHSGHLRGFDYVEVEFDNEEEARAFESPYWCGREVTDDPRFTYGKLARVNGFQLAKMIMSQPPEQWAPYAMVMPDENAAPKAEEIREQTASAESAAETEEAEMIEAGDSADNADDAKDAKDVKDAEDTQDVQTAPDEQQEQLSGAERGREDGHEMTR